MMKGDSTLHKVAFILLAIGGLNWLLVGVVQWDIGQIFGGMDALISRIIYILVGLSAVLVLFGHKMKMGGGGAGGSSMPQGGGGQPS